MTKAENSANAGKPGAAKADKSRIMTLDQRADEDPGEVLARAVLGQNLRHGHVSSVYAKAMVEGSGETLGLMECSKVVQKQTRDAIKGDLSFASAMLASQAMTLDNMFTEFARRAAANMGEYPQATERYARLAMKAQSNARTSLEALAKLHQPREQTVRHVHVSEGGQAVIADQFHHHGGTDKSVESGKQSDATGAAGQSAALPGPDALGSGVPIPGGDRQAAMQDARRHEPGTA